MGAKPEIRNPIAVLATAMKVLGEPRRLRVLRVLMQAEDTLCGCEIADVLDIPDYQVSRDLSALRKAGVVRDRGRSGTWVHYEAVTDPQNPLTPLIAVIRDQTLDDGDTRRLALRLQLRAEVGCVLGPSHPEVIKAFQRAGLRESP